VAAKTKKPAKKGGKKPAKETKAETVETSTGVQLLLGNMMAQKDREYYVNTYLGLKGKCDKANSDLSEFGKKAKEAGVDMKAMKQVLGMEKLDAIDVADFLKQMAAFARDRGLPVQIQLFQPKFGTLEAQATQLGWDAGINGRNPPVDLFPEGTPGHPEMMRAWNDSQAQLVSQMKVINAPEPKPEVVAPKEGEKDWYQQ
jgi:uncharacterized protein (UPF0335 family)